MNRSTRLYSLAFALLATGCNSTPTNQCKPDDLVNRAYIVSKDNDEVHVIDMNCWEVVGVVNTGGQSLHMAELNADFTKLYVDSSDTNETVVVDTKTIAVKSRIVTPKHPTHASLSPDGKFMAVAAEDENAVMLLDTSTDKIARTIPGFHIPHFVRFTADGLSAYVANIGAHHLTRIDMPSQAIVEHISLDGFTVPTEAADEGGFADAQIDPMTGTLYAAHAATGKVMVYDTKSRQKLSELAVGMNPWIVYAEHPFASTNRRPVVPSFGDETAQIIDGDSKTVLASLPIADKESFGVNYSSQTPGQAFLMNRFKEEIAVVDTQAMKKIDTIAVGGTTETASTTADGKYIVATVSSINRVVVIEAATHKIFKTFDNIGKYPWSVTIPKGQNYCH
jgi:DNA-binding beta-propeller fold protein YncE